MKKFLALLLVLMFALPSLAVQYLAESGKHMFSASPEIVYGAFISSLDANKYTIISTDSKNYITKFCANKIDFMSTIIPDGKKDALVQITPANPNALVPVSIYRRIFTITQEIILKPNAKSRTFYFAN